VRSSTTAGPTSTSSGTDSIVGAPSTKCAGASTWVPVCEPMSQRLTLPGSPAAIDSTIVFSGLRP
jgi:hypothetical protein